ncbi:MAG: hypothetical protein U1E28_05170 [Beijerinckiaceae bacterium]
MASLAAWAGAFTAEADARAATETVASRVLVSAAPLWHKRAVPDQRVAMRRPFREKLR